MIRNRGRDSRTFEHVGTACLVEKNSGVSPREIHGGRKSASNFTAQNSNSAPLRSRDDRGTGYSGLPWGIGCSLDRFRTSLVRQASALLGADANVVRPTGNRRPPGVPSGAIGQRSRPGLGVERKRHHSQSILSKNLDEYTGPHSAAPAPADRSSASSARRSEHSGRDGDKRRRGGACFEIGPERSR